MFTFPVSRQRIVLLLIFGLGFFARVSRADLLWDPETGWRIEGGVMSGITGTEGRGALDLMNQGRRDEDDYKNRAALKAYVKVTKKYSTSVYAPEAYYRIANIRLARHQYVKAFEAYQTISSSAARYPQHQAVQ